MKETNKKQKRYIKNDKIERKAETIKEEDVSSKATRGELFKESKKDKERRWYAVHTYSGYEDAVVRYLNQRVESLSMSDKIFNVIVPKENKIRIKNGKRKV